MARATSSSGSKGAKGGAPDASMRIVVLTGKDSYLRVERARQLQDALEATFGAVDRFEFDGASAQIGRAHV